MNILRSLITLLLVCLAHAIGCGTNKFEAEVATEEAAVKLANETIEGGYQLISTNELKQMLDDDEDFLLIDAMPAVDSFAKGHIHRAVNFTFPIEVMDGWSDNVMGGRKQEKFQQMLGEARDRRIVVYCGFVKCARSHNAAICAQELGFTNVYRYPGGIYAWRGSGYALTTD